MKYIAIDIETTGLDPDKCQVLEIAAIYDDGESAVEDLPQFHAIVRHDEIKGEAKALSMNSHLLLAIAAGDGVYAEDVISNFSDWLDSLNYKKGGKPAAFVLAGKNVGSFDFQFLKRMPGFPTKRFDHRFVDVGCLYITPKDSVIPSQKYCLRRAGLPDTVTHQAIDDAMQVVQLIRAWKERFAS